MATPGDRLNTYELINTSGAARRGRFHTQHGSIEMPAFMPVGTQGGVKALAPAEVADTGAQVLIANTYHLWLRPGAELVAELGGLHQFMRWPHAIATDSGGFQAFSLAKRTRVTEDGFEFQSHLDGRRAHLSPEESMRVQDLLGTDIALQLDICPPAGVERALLVEAVERTTRWAERCLAARRSPAALFGIVQGGLDLELRSRHAEMLSALPLDGIALGGFSVGEPTDQMHAVLKQLVPTLDPHRPHYLMGVGTPSDLVRAIGTGIDLFDCVMPTRNARNGQAFTRQGKVIIRNARYRADPRPLDPACSCAACAGGFSRSYLRHLFVAGELLAHRLISIHNVHFYQSVVREAREAIEQDSYDAWACRMLSDLEGVPVA